VPGGLASDGTDSRSGLEEIGVNLGADIDVDTGVVTLPYDRFRITNVESDILWTARSGAVAASARNSGLTWTGWDLRGGDYSASHIWHVFGPWRQQDAEKFGFMVPMSDAGLMARGLIPKSEGYTEPTTPNTQLSQAQIDEVGSTCSSDPQAMEFAEEELLVSSPWLDAIYEVDDAINQDPRSLKVFDALAQCYSGQGMTFDEDSPGYVIGADQEKISEDQITMALKVADCQNQVDSTRRLADIWADLQAPIITKYASELAAGRETIDEAVSNAETFISTHAELYVDQ